MRSSLYRTLASLLTIASVLAIGGCGGTEVELKKVPESEIVKVKPGEEPKTPKPRAGSSSGMNYDPSGVTPKQ
jgi:hypothetical protein